MLEDAGRRAVGFVGDGFFTAVSDGLAYRFVTNLPLTLLIKKDSFEPLPKLEYSGGSNASVFQSQICQLDNFRPFP
jgi:hypothetical protein